MRAFIAVELPEVVHVALEDLKVRLREAGVRASWVNGGNIHLTLRFLGEIEEDQAGRLIDMLESEYVSVRRFVLEVRGVGAFPNARRPSVLWAGCEPAEGPLERVQRAAETAARAVGLAPEAKAFRPHLTVARVKDWRAAGPVSEALDREQGFTAGEFEAAGVALFRSRLMPSGAVYERLKEFRFS
ncbi:MAG: RNA 2',3'-cyclic phosphodiesterase [Candidatus Hydrogenedentes bacterium]|nr:RNA 2',3'-cyclic phosphodiesterase [Candidatus Hydrogenedentota bacterium]